MAFSMLRALAVLTAAVLTAAVALTGAAPPGSAAPHADPRRVPRAVIVAAGNIACPPQAYVGPDRCRAEATARAAESLDPDRVLALGDLQYPAGGLAAFTSSYGNSWGLLKNRTWPVVGDREYRTPGARGFFGYFDRGSEPPGWYRRELNGWQVLVLNSNCGQVDCLRQRNWMRRQLVRHPSRCALIALHHPRFSSGAGGSVHAMKKFWAVAQRNGADLVVSAHDRDYERFRVQDAAGYPDAEGMQQLVIGNGGHSLGPRGRTAAGSIKFLNHSFGVLKLTLRPYGWSWQYRDTALTLRDSGSSACR